MNNVELYTKAKEEYLIQKNKAQNVMKQALLETIKTIFEKNPNLEYFKLKGFTPYFNDGDECVYSIDVASPFIKVKEYDEEYDEYSFSNDNFEEEKKFNSIYSKIAHDLYLNLGIFEDDDFKETFGDHQTIIFYPDRIEQEDFDSHD